MMAAEFKNRLALVDRKLEQLQAEYAQFREAAKQEAETLLNQRKVDMESAKKEREKLLAQKQMEMEQAARAAADEMAEKIRAELPPPGPNVQAIENQLRQDIESEYMDKMREKESEVESKIAQTREENKKELERLKWEGDSLKEELRRAREARTQLEREAQELLTQAEEHFRRELEKQLSHPEQTGRPAQKGIFTSIGMTIGKILDTPIIDTKKKKNDPTAPS
jgi:chromosome segregation ATPase